MTARAAATARCRHRRRLHRLRRSGSTSRCSRRCRRPWSTPATRTSPTAGTRSSTSSTRSACGSPTRCTPARSPTTTGRPCATLEAIGHREAFGLNWDPCHFVWQDLDPVGFLWDFSDRIYHVDCKDTKLPGRQRPQRPARLAPAVGRPAARLGLRLHRPRRRAVGGCFRMLNTIGYDGPISVEWEDAGHGPPASVPPRRWRSSSACLRPADGGLRRAFSSP